MSIYLLGILQQLERLDQWLFIRINSGLANPFFDLIMPFARYPMNWAPLYVFLAAFALLNFKSKGAWWILFFIVTIPLTDMTGTYIFKKGFERIRPCGDPDFYFHVRLLADRCSTGFSFISNHAANHFGLATFFYLTTRPLFKNWSLVAFVWAAWIAIAQVYVGLHYPGDILAGAVIGLIFGTLTATLFNKKHGFSIFELQSTVSP